LAFVAALHPRVRLSAESIRRSDFTRELLDTGNRSFAARGLKLRVRRHASRLMCTFKAIALDRYVVRRSRVAPAPAFRSKAVTKFEEGIYALHSAFSKQATVPMPLGWQFSHVSDWGRVFPGALEVSRPDEPLVIISKRAIRRTHKMVLEFEDISAEAMLELGFVPGSASPETADFSWKYRRKKGPFAPTTVLLMRRFSQALNQSSWADWDVHLRKALSDAGASWSSPLVDSALKSPGGTQLLHAELREEPEEEEEEEDNDDSEESDADTSTADTAVVPDAAIPDAAITEPDGFDEDLESTPVDSGGAVGTAEKPGPSEEPPAQ
jgi:hypothetical protein